MNPWNHAAATPPWLQNRQSQTHPPSGSVASVPWAGQLWAYITPSQTFPMQPEQPARLSKPGSSSDCLFFGVPSRCLRDEFRLAAEVSELSGAVAVQIAAGTARIAFDSKQHADQARSALERDGICGEILQSVSVPTEPFSFDGLLIASATRPEPPPADSAHGELIERAADYIALLGRELEVLLLRATAHDVRFAFLRGGPYSRRFLWLLARRRRGLCLELSPATASASAAESILDVQNEGALWKLLAGAKSNQAAVTACKDWLVTHANAAQAAGLVLYRFLHDAADSATVEAVLDVISSVLHHGVVLRGAGGLDALTAGLLPSIAGVLRLAARSASLPVRETSSALLGQWEERSLLPPPLLFALRRATLCRAPDVTAAAAELGVPAVLAPESDTERAELLRSHTALLDAALQQQQHQQQQQQQQQPPQVMYPGAPYGMPMPMPMPLPMPLPLHASGYAVPQPVQLVQRLNEFYADTGAEAAAGRERERDRHTDSDEDNAAGASPRTRPPPAAAVRSAREIADAEEATQQLGARPGLGMTALADEDPFVAFRRQRASQYRERLQQGKS